jgi:hypothetical protein
MGGYDFETLYMKWYMITRFISFIALFLELYTEILFYIAY